MIPVQRRASWVVLGLLLACEPQGQASHSAPVPSAFAAPTDWTTVPEASVIVVRVGDAPITRQRVLDVQAASPGLDAHAVLERLIDLEVLAQRAVQLGHGDSPRVRQLRRESLIQRYLTARFEADVTPESLPLAKVQEFYYLPNIRKLYDHAAAWRMGHVFFTCCDSTNESCDHPEIVACFAESGGTIQTVYSELKTLTATAEADPDAILAILETYRQDNETRFMRHPFAFRTRGFYYDPAKPHSEQKGYDLIVEAVARAVTDAPLAVVQPPVQSPFGWHVVVKLGHDPEDRRGPTEPSVVEDIRNNMLPKMRWSRFGSLLARLAQERGVDLDPAPLQHLNVRFNARL